MLDIGAPKTSLECDEASAEDGVMTRKAENMSISVTDVFFLKTKSDCCLCCYNRRVNEFLKFKQKSGCFACFCSESILHDAKKSISC